MADPPRDLLARPALEAVRLLCLGYLDDASAALCRIADPAEEEALHDFRVAVRRLRSCARAWRPELRGSVKRGARRRLRELARATGGSRDAEVHLAWLESKRKALTGLESPGLAALRGRLEARRRAGYDAAARDVAPRFAAIEADLRPRLSSFEQPVARDGAGVAETYARALAARIAPHAEALGSHLARIGSSADERAAHTARIRAKRLRYLVEPARPAVEPARATVKRLKSLQDLLGELHDAHVFSAEVAASTQDVGTRALLDLLREEQERLFARLSAGWLGANAEAFFAKVAELRAALRRTAGPDREIERKYLLSSLPDAARGTEPVRIEQGWLPGQLLQERVRRVSAGDETRHYRTVKLGEGVERVEVEEEADAELFEALWPLTRGRRVCKLRYRIPDGDFVWEVDAFMDRDLVLAEVELPSAEVRPPLPGWLAPLVQREVTGEPAYLNVNLAR